MRDSNVNVRAKAVWGLANLFNDAANATNRTQQDKVAENAAETPRGGEGKYWTEEDGDGGDAIGAASEQIRPALCVDKEIMLSVVEEAITMAVHDSDKVQSNAVRLLGYLCVHLLPSIVAPGVEPGGDVGKEEQGNLDQLLSKLAHSLIQSVYPQAGMQLGGHAHEDRIPISYHPAVKVQWNACSASGLLLRASR